MPTIVTMSGRMAAAGLLDRRSDNRDNRLVRLYLTPAGRALVEPIQQTLERIDAQATAGLSARERATLLTLLSKVCDNAEKHVDDWNSDPAEH